MLRTFYRLLFLSFILAGAMRSSAQQNLRTDIAVWSVGSYVADAQFITIQAGTLEFSFEEKPGYGVSVNHFWTDNVSTEVSVMRFRADLVVTQSLIPETFKLGELDWHAVSGMGQYHFRQGARVMPYLGAGVAYAGGSFDYSGDQVDGNDLESKVTWTAAAGMNVHLTQRIALSFEAKRVSFDSHGEGTGFPTGEIEIDPMLYGSGVRFRF